MAKISRYSFSKLTSGATKVITQYPLVVIVAVLKTVFLIWRTEINDYVESQNDDFEYLLLRLTAVMFLALPLVYLCYWLAIKYKISLSQKIISFVLVAVLLTLYYFSFAPEPNQVDYYRFGIYFLVVHALVAFGAHFKGTSLLDFWQHNKNMGLQFLNSSIYSIILFLGLVVAIFAIRLLFGVQFGFEIELYLFYVLTLFIHTLFFMNGVEQERHKEASFPKVLKWFAQYALLPLVVIYFVILYAYSIKILINWELPEGGVAYLVLSLAIAGTLAYLLIYPWQNHSEERGIRIFSKYFFPAILPLNLLLFIGILRRISDYDITENRYLVFVLAIWLAGISLYFIFSGKRDIRVIPLTMVFVGLIISMGPWGVFSLSESSQKSRFEQLLSEEKLLDSNGKITGKATVNNKKYHQIFSIVDYFNERDNLQVLEPYFEELNDTLKSDSRNHWYGHIRTTLSNHIFADTILLNDFIMFNVKSDYRKSNAISVSNFDYLWDIYLADSAMILNEGYVLRIPDSEGILMMSEGEKVIARWNLEEKVKELQIKYGQSQYEIETEDMLIESVDKNSNIRLMLSSIGVNQDRSAPHQRKYDVTGKLLFRINEKNDSKVLE